MPDVPDSIWLLLIVIVALSGAFWYQHRQSRRPVRPAESQFETSRHLRNIVKAAARLREEGK